MGKLEGKVAVITGGSSGLALASAKRFVEEGAYVFITGRRQEQLDEAVKLIGRNVTGVRGDAANLDDLDRLFDTVKREKGKIDVLFASAGRGEALALGEITEQHFDAAFDLNTRGTLFTVQKALALFNDGGSIIMTGFRRFGEGLPRLRRLCGEQGSIALLRTHVAQRTEGQKDPGERAKPGADRHTDAGGSSHQRGEGDVRIPDPSGNDGASRRNCNGRTIPRFRRFQLREWSGVVRRRRSVGHLRSTNLGECMSQGTHRDPSVSLLRPSQRHHLSAGVPLSRRLEPLF